MKVCMTNENCEKDPSMCGYSINCSSFDDYENGEPTRFIGGIDCPYAKWNKIDRAKEIGKTDKPSCNLTSCRYNTDGKCENEEKRKECVEVSKLVLCELTERKIVQLKHDENDELLIFYDGKLVNNKIARCTKTEESKKTIITVELKCN